MSVRMRKSVRLGPGLRLTATRGGASLRVGGRGFGYSMSTSGRRTVSGGIPGSGVGFQRSSGGGRRAERSSAPVAPLRPPKPGLLASGYEKAFHKAVQTYAQGDVSGAVALFREAAAKDTSDKALADDLFAGILSVQVEDDDQAIPYLEKVVASDQALPDRLMQKYVPERSWPALSAGAGGDARVRRAADQ
jgi:hypothetical protein